MAIKTSTFSGWKLSGKDAQTILHQVESPAPNPMAKNAIKRGEKLAKEYLSKGFVVLSSSKKAEKLK